MTTPTDAPAEGTAGSGRILAALVIAVFGYALMQTLLVPALGLLQSELHTTPEWSAWILSAFLLSSAVLTPLIGRMGDQYGKRRVLLWVLAVYGLGTLGAAAAQTIGQLIAARVVQGSALSVLPLAFAILRETLPPKRLHLGTGMVSGVVGVGAGGGLVVGGLLADHFSWRALFVLGAILATVSLVLVAWWVPDSRHTEGGRLDLAGAALLGLGLVALLLALTEGPGWGWTSWRVLGLFLLALCFFAVLAAVESGRSNALVDIAEFTHRPMLLTHLSAFAFGVLSYVFYVALPRFAQTPHEAAGFGFGATITLAGLLMLPGALTVLPASMAVGWIARHAGERAPLVIGFLVCAVGSALLAAAHTAMWQHLVFYALVGVGTGLVMAALPKLIGALAPPTRMGTANGINNIARTVGGVVGSQLAAAFLSAGATGGTVTGSTYTSLFWLATAVGLAGAVIAPLAAVARAGSGAARVPASGHTEKELSG
ncbi:MFS transporter [Streptomyces sp. NBC_00878]|uniref:MFS transporter n=1 Tax=Streptomyces sp. NBC_00878 TaxID=2975854 RepID=UPI0022584D59|nr:MFS transporter [Streptomyces sp. NBC_00878]MCX4906887.1 MFS transporter [Streptomyces sp. NBC_00878]